MGTRNIEYGKQNEHRWRVRSTILSGFSEILFPRICVCCAGRLAPAERYLCRFCRKERFESVLLPMEDPLLLPSFAEFRISLWKFEKGGELQSLLHKLKYGALYGLGREIGMELGYRMKRLLYSEGYGRYAGRLVPVPLHPRQVRTRGGNQARAIAEGVSSVTGWETVPEGFVLRNRYTRSQTGLRREERLENVSGIFDIDPHEIAVTEQTEAGEDSDVGSGPVKRPEGPVIWIVVDDVFTTGATTFELAKTLHEKGAGHIGIATAASA